VAWSWAFDCPFKWTKQVASHFGGTRQGMCIAWPNRIKDAGGIRTQFHHMVDIVPTILEAAGVTAPTMVNGVEQKPMEGTSMVYTFDKANATAASTRSTQYFEMFGNRAIYHDGWIACTTPPAAPWLLGTAKMPEDILNGYNWELYNLNDDYSESNDLAAKSPDKLRELQELFLVEATKNNVFPMDNSILQRLVTPRPSSTAGRSTFTYTGVMGGISTADAPSFLDRSYSISADIEVPASGAEGVINTLGGRFGGYGLYLLKGKPIFIYNMVDLERYRWEGKQALAPGKHNIEFDFTYEGPGFGKGGTGAFKVDGKEVATQKIPHTIPFIMAIDETFDVGIDLRTSINDKDYQVPFRFTGKIDKLTINVQPPQIAEADQEKLRERAVAAE
jgi:hypothetical protein